MVPTTGVSVTTMDDIQNLIERIIRSQKGPFCAKEVMFATRDALAGTPYAEKKNFVPVAHMCARTLRTWKYGGIIIDRDDGTYVLAEEAAAG